MRREYLTVPSDSVLVMHQPRHRCPPQVGQGWQPEVAQFLLDMYPDALEKGFRLSDLYQMVSPDQWEVQFDELASLFDAFDDTNDGDEDL